jgi:hypothetical protein
VVKGDKNSKTGRESKQLPCPFCSFTPMIKGRDLKFSIAWIGDWATLLALMISSPLTTCSHRESMFAENDHEVIKRMELIDYELVEKFAKKTRSIEVIFEYVAQDRDRGEMEKLRWREGDFSRDRSLRRLRDLRHWRE